MRVVFPEYVMVVGDENGRGGEERERENRRDDGSGSVSMSVPRVSHTNLASRAGVPPQAEE
jgi:hypothetical protein